MTHPIARSAPDIVYFGRIVRRAPDGTMGDSLTRSIDSVLRRMADGVVAETWYGPSYLISTAHVVPKPDAPIEVVEFIDADTGEHMVIWRIAVERRDKAVTI